TVGDMDRAVDFYSKVLFFEKVSDAEVAGDALERLQGIFGARARIVTLRLGDERLELTEHRASRGRPAPAAARGNDRRPPLRASVVGDAEASLGSYRDVRGMRVVGGSEHRGPEQERLNNVSGPRLRITTLRAPAGPAVELLEYLTPRDGRPYPVDARANDLVHWHTIVATSSPEAVYRALLAGRYPLVSPRVVTLPDGPLGSREAFLARDPDGHALQFRSR